MAAELFCIECHQLRNKFRATPVMGKDGEIAGWQCQKCEQKSWVGSPGKDRAGWRERLREFFESIKKDLAAQKNIPQVVRTPEKRGLQ